LWEIFSSTLETINTTFMFMMPLTNLIAKIDLLHSYAKVAFRNNYYRPTIDPSETGRSYLEARDLRHPIIERIIDGPYVTNDVFLGAGDELGPQTSSARGSNRSDGLLLFGLNQVGKSSLGKALALNIIMAQAGSFVPSRLHYKPFAKLITRLNGGDNIFKGQSSFATEMSELRTILRQADARTLVIGDEIAHTSETISATAITVSAILKLLELEATFLFASHMHEVLTVPDLQSIPVERLRVSHLSVSKDMGTGVMIYDRKLKDGPGDSIYGILVAETLDLPPDFIAKAYEVAQYVRGQPKNLVSPVAARYNREVYLDVCRLCGGHSELQTHHLQEQHTADANGMIGHMHKNNKGNLVVLCRNCHQSLHQAGQSLVMADTSMGKTVITGTSGLP
jgi:DNA mismatch repair protein MutS